MADGSGSKRIGVRAHADHLRKMAACRHPRVAIEELIWNALDADATQVEVTLRRSNLGGLESIVISDNGHGIEPAHAEDFFGDLGGSWKKRKRVSVGRRRKLHGKEGRGRFRAFSLGERVRWSTRYQDSAGEVREYSITGQSNAPVDEYFNASPEITSKTKATGTIVTIDRLDDTFADQLEQPNTAHALLERLVPYFFDVPEVVVTYDGQTLDPATAIQKRSEYSIDVNGAIADLRVVEFARKTERAINLCNEDWFVLHAVTPNIQAPEFEFAAYLRHAGFSQLSETGELEVGELSPDVRGFVDAAREQLKEHFRRRRGDLRKSRVEEWQAEGIYPFKGPPKSEVSKLKRKTFDYVALQVEERVEKFADASVASRRLAFRLLKAAIETGGPEHLQRILHEVLELPKERQKDLAELLDKANLASIISTARMVTDRLEFIAGLRELVFDDYKTRLQERSQLHRLLDRNPWVFGEEYTLTTSEEGLTKLVNKHRKAVGLEAIPKKLVRGDDGGVLIPDLVLSRKRVADGEDAYEHLVVELKRPTQVLDEAVLTQTKQYARAIACDEAFDFTKTHWRFVAVSNTLSASVRDEATARDRDPGKIHDNANPRYTVWVMTWAQVLRQNERRLQFLQEKLEYEAQGEEAVNRMRKLYGKLIPDEG